MPLQQNKIIVSYHNFSETPDNLSEVYNKLSQSIADVIKIVTYANDITDNIKIYQLLHQSKNQQSLSVWVNMALLVVSCIKIWQLFDLASLQRGKESAPGQISIHELLNTYHIGKQDGQTAIYGLIGNPVSHSISPIIHNTLFNEMGFNSIYVPFKVNNIGNFIREFRGLDVKGYSVTIPHKESIINHLDAIDPMAKKIGAVNTVVNSDGKLIGFNTDCEAAIKALHSVYKLSEVSKKDDHLKGKKVTLLGAGSSPCDCLWIKRAWSTYNDYQQKLRAGAITC